MSRIETSAGVPLIDEFDPESVIRAIPDDYLRKGMLFPRHVKALGEQFVSLPLEARPPSGRYDPLESYLARDYFRLFNAVAERAFPSEPRSQQWRLLARREVESVTGTALGRVEFSALDDPRDALLRYEQFSRFVITKPLGIASELRKNAMRIDFTDPVVSTAYSVGMFEGIVMTFGMHPRVAIETNNGVTSFEVRWGL